MARNKPAITGIARPEGIKDDIGEFLFKTAAKRARKAGSKAHSKMSKMTPDTAEKKFIKQYDKFTKSNAKADRLGAKARKMRNK